VDVEEDRVKGGLKKEERKKRSEANEGWMTEQAKH
jgi:hypothetical protein